MGRTAKTNRRTWSHLILAQSEKPSEFTNKIEHDIVDELLHDLIVAMNEDEVMYGKA